MPLLHCGIDLTGDAYRAFRGKKLTCNASNGLEFVGAFFDDGDLDGHDELRTGRKSEKSFIPILEKSGEVIHPVRNPSSPFH